MIRFAIVALVLLLIPAYSSAQCINCNSCPNGICSPCPGGMCGVQSRTSVPTQNFARTSVPTQNFARTYAPPTQNFARTYAPPVQNFTRFYAPTQSFGRSCPGGVCR